jgi:hypothetical protein
MNAAYSFAIASVLALSTIGLTGCGTYRVVHRTPAGGEVALEGSEEKAREAANEYMASQCPYGFDVIEEGEAVVGSETTASTRKEKVFGVPVSSTRSQTTDKREWRLKYQCRGTNATAVGDSTKQGAIQELVIRY